MEELEKSIGYTFKDKKILKNALTHTSYAYEHHVESNEKLEFLGDSILEFLSSKYIYNNYTTITFCRQVNLPDCCKKLPDCTAPPTKLPQREIPPGR